MRIILFILAIFFCIEFNSCGILPSYTLCTNDSLAVRAILDSNGFYNEDVYSIVQVLGGRARYLYIGPYGGGPSSQANLAWKIGLSADELQQITKMPKQIGDLDRLDSIRINQTTITTLPNEIANLRDLLTLDIQHNKINLLPDSLKKFEKLERLNADSNSLITCPSLPSSLVNLSLNYNNLISFPNTIYQCSTLISLLAASNAISHLSDSIEYIKQLIYLRLDKNNLSIIPLTLMKLVYLQRVDISYNHLVSLPAELDSFICYRQSTFGDYDARWKSRQIP